MREETFEPKIPSRALPKGGPDCISSARMLPFGLLVYSCTTTV